MPASLFASRTSAPKAEPVVDQCDDAQLTLDAFSRSQALIEFKPDGTILTANDNFLAVLGYSLAEIQGQHHRMFVDPSEASSPEYAAFWKSLGGGEFAVGEYKRFTKDRKEIWISASYNPVSDDTGRVVKVVKIASDITETKRRSLDQLARFEALSRSQAVIEFEVDGTIIWANDNFLGAVGYSLAEIQGQHHRMFCQDSYANNQEYTDFWSKLKSGQYIAGRFLRVAKNGDEIWIQASYNPVIDDKGQPIKVIKVASDISEQMRRELDTKKEAADVGQTVASSTTEMASTIEEISKSVGRTASLASDAEQYARASSDSTEQLQESSKAIGKVVNVIQELADQTNLLALNATIEAARAGESGRSFAVVANEVKDLAQETSNATQSIEQSVAEIQSRINDVTSSIEKISESVSEVSSNTNTVAAAIEEQSITMGELSKTAEELVSLADRSS